MKFINSFNLQLSNSGKTIVPEVISITLDNGLTYMYPYKKNKDKQNFIFNDTRTRYVKLDIIRTSDGYIDPSNVVISNNIERNILSSEIIHSINGSKVTITVPNVATITGVKYYNIYLKTNGKVPSKPVLSKLRNDTSSVYTMKS